MQSLGVVCVLARWHLMTQAPFEQPLHQPLAVKAPTGLWVLQAVRLLWQEA